MTRDPRTDPQPGDKRVYAYNPNAYDTVLSRTADAVYVQATYANLRPSTAVCDNLTLAEWASAGVWPRAATYVAGLPCCACAKSRSRATACGDVPAGDVCPRYYPRAGA